MKSAAVGTDASLAAIRAQDWPPGHAMFDNLNRLAKLCNPANRQILAGKTPISRPRTPDFPGISRPFWTPVGQNRANFAVFDRPVALARLCLPALRLPGQRPAVARHRSSRMCARHCREENATRSPRADASARAPPPRHKRASAFRSRQPSRKSSAARCDWSYSPRAANRRPSPDTGNR